jgi:hypothetical protein
MRPRMPGDIAATHVGDPWRLRSSRATGPQHNRVGTLPHAAQRALELASEMLVAAPMQGLYPQPADRKTCSWVETTPPVRYSIRNRTSGDGAFAPSQELFAFEPRNAPKLLVGRAGRRKPAYTY